MTKKEQLIIKVKNFEEKYFNDDQKRIAISILESAPKEEVQSYADFIFMKRRTGFAFDYSPEIAKGKLITLREDKKRRINVNEEISDEENKLIIGDNYNALKSLIVTHKSKIDIIYIDPPYNTESMSKDGNSSHKTGKANTLLYKNKYGRGGWLNLMKQRLTLAKDLLSKNGVLFMTIDDSEQAYLKVLSDDIFKETNFIGSFPIKSQPNGRILNGILRKHEYILIYKNSINNEIILKEENDNNKLVSFLRGGDNSLAKERPKRFYPIIISKEKLVSINDKEYESIYDENKNIFNEFNIDKINKKYSNFQIIWPIDSKGIRKVWQRSFDRFKKELNIKIIYDKLSNSIKTMKESETYLSSWLDDKKFSYSHHGAVIMKQILPNSEFRYPKSAHSIKHLIKSVPQTKKALILDFFAGSGTTGQAVMELNREDGGNRKFILCTNNENDIAHNVTYERLHRIIKGVSFKDNKSDFDWLKNNEIYKEEKLRVINIDDSIKISLDEKIDNKIYEDAKNGLKLLDRKYNKQKLNLYYDLAALNPLENNEDKF